VIFADGCAIICLVSLSSELERQVAALRVYQIIINHGFFARSFDVGGIRAVGEIGKGARFEFWLGGDV
jgi:hypothetical protein